MNTEYQYRVSTGSRGHAISNDLNHAYESHVEHPGSKIEVRTCRPLDKTSPVEWSEWEKLKIND